MLPIDRSLLRYWLRWRQWYKDFYDVTGYDQVIVKVRNLKDIDQVKDSIDAQLNRRETEVNVYDTKAILETILETFGRISTLIDRTAPMPKTISPNTSTRIDNGLRKAKRIKFM